MSSFNNNKKPGNVWFKNSSNVTSNSNLTTSSSETKFKEAQVKLQAAVEKYAKDYESSSSEDELESGYVIDSVLKNYSKFGGKSEHLTKTITFLEDALSSGAAICLICIGTIKRIEKIWNCNSCYCSFHLHCIERWSKDSVVQQKESLQEQSKSETKVQWGCPKCRYEYNPDQIPREYVCFCGKTVNPPFQPWLTPHSCGNTCNKHLKPLCGHECTLLCHPGPCPPCPKTVKVTCFCGSKPEKIQRCSNKEWSCGSPCNSVLNCGKHSCTKPCHAGQCPPCSKQSTQKCQCGAEEKLTTCANPIWHCPKVCSKPLSCGSHRCEKICHKESCGDCVLSQPRTCPCGKTTYKLSCTEETPNCGDTCGKLLECGAHTCNQRCHKEKCGTCLEMAIKSCRCGLHKKEIQCNKQYVCETKCKRMRDCQRHPCNRKCCDGTCPTCEKPCGRTLTCGIHKCSSVCHRGPCYPCTQTTTVRCRCGKSSNTVPCGRRKRPHPPKCLRLCIIPPDCHHSIRRPHKCHFGECPPCNQTCNKLLDCYHYCPAVCHTFVLVRVKPQKASMPWEQTGEILERKCLPCPECKELVSVTCLGGHETSTWPCCIAKRSSCHRPCGRLLSCKNHTCHLECHEVQNSDSLEADGSCERCENPCSFPRPEGCQHICPKPCHSGSCPSCTHILRLKCHCGLNQLYVRCDEWTSKNADKEKLQSCGIQCPKMYNCGHRCKSNCHSGLCPNPELCKKKVKVFCSCKRIKKEFSCELVRNNMAVVECDDNCEKKKAEELKIRQTELEAKKKLEEAKNAKELEEFQKKFQGKKKYKDKKKYSEVAEESFLRKYWIPISAFIVVLFTLYTIW